MVGTQLFKLSLHRCACPTVIRQWKGQGSSSRRRPNVKFDGQSQTANFLHLANDSTAEDEGNPRSPQLPLFQTQSYPTAVILRIVTVMAAVLMIQEERKVDEFGPEPKPEEVEGACEVSLMKTINVAEEGYQGGVESRQWYDRRGVWDERCRRRR